MYNTTLYTDLKSYFRRYVDTDETEIGFLVIYATGTHFYKQYQSYPILHITGDFATGKNRRLDLLKLFCLNPIILSSPTLPSLFRLIEESSGTILIDEADDLLRFRDMETLLLVGYKNGGQIPRSVRDSSHEMEFRPTMFNVYCPKVLVTREGLPSDALKSRSITIITFPKSEDSKVPDILRDEDFSEGRELRKSLDSLLAKLDKPDSQDIGLNLSGRDSEIFDCIEDVAVLYGEDAITDLHDFIEEIYIPETGYTTMMTLNEDLIRILYQNWDIPGRIYLTDIKTNLQIRSGDYRTTSEKQIAGSLRGLKFELGRDGKGTYVNRNEEHLKKLLRRYSIVTNDSESFISISSDSKPILDVQGNTLQTLCVEDVADEAKSSNGRPKRRYLREQFSSILERIRLRG